MKASTILLCKEHLFTDADELRKSLSPADVDRILRCRVMYLFMLEHPEAKDANFVEVDCDRHGISRPTAYADLSVIKSILPELSDSAREFHRWRYNQMILDTYEAAKKRGDTRTMEKAATSYARYNKIDSEREEIDLADIQPQPFTPTLDPSVLGIQPMKNLREKKKKLLEELSREVADVQDISFEEVDLSDLIQGSDG